MLLRSFDACAFCFAFFRRINNPSLEESCAAVSRMAAVPRGAVVSRVAVVSREVAVSREAAASEVVSSCWHMSISMTIGAILEEEAGVKFARQSSDFQAGCEMARLSLEGDSVAVYIRGVGLLEGEKE